MNCPRCRENLNDKARFCSNCGLSFAGFNTPTEHLPLDGMARTRQATDPLLGRILDSKYELVSRLGEGGMGTVYRGRRVHIGDEVAVKVLLDKFLSVPTAIERFRREARAAAMLRHPNVVAIYDFGESPDQSEIPAYIVMELVEGESLRELLKREVRLDLERACMMMRDICLGVGAAHKREIVHRDLKPDNIIVMAADEDHEREMVKVVDFGIAKLRDLVAGSTLTQSGVAMGTPYYMSPEQCRGDSLDPSADVYSLGAMLYEMLTGEPPFTAKTATGVVAKHLTEAPPPLPEQLRVPQGIETLIMRALSKQAEGRPRDALAFARELQAVLTGSKAVNSSTPTLRANIAPTQLPAEPVPQADVPPRILSNPSQETITVTTPEVASSTGSISASHLGSSTDSDVSTQRDGRKLWLGIILAGLVLAGLVSAAVFGLRSGGDKAAVTGVPVSKPEPTPLLSQGTGSQSLNRPSTSAPGTLLHTLNEKRIPREVAITPDGQSVVSIGEGNKVRLWRISDGSLLREITDFPQKGRCVAVSPDSQVIASGHDDGVIRLWSVKDGRLLRALQGHTGYVFIVSFSPDGEKLVSASEDKTLRLWRVSDGSQLGSVTVTAPKELIITMSPSQRILALLGPDKGVRLWSLNDNALLRKLEGHRFEIKSGAFSPDEKILALGSSDGILRLWEVESGKLLRALEGAKDKEVRSVAFNPAGDVVIAGWLDGSIRMWSVSDGNAIGTLEGHTARVNSLSISPDGTVLASGSGDETIRLWQIAGR